MSANDADWYGHFVAMKTDCLNAAVNFVECNFMDYASTAEDVLAVADKFVAWTVSTGNAHPASKPLPKPEVNEDSISKAVTDALDRIRKGTGEPKNNFPGPMGT